MYDRLLSLLSEGQGEMFDDNSLPKPVRGRKSNKPAPGIKTSAESKFDAAQEQAKAAQEQAKAAQEEPEAAQEKEKKKARAERIRKAINKARGIPNSNLP